MLQMITVCLWTLYDAMKLLDSGGLILAENDAEAPCFGEHK